MAVSYPFLEGGEPTAPQMGGGDPALAALAAEFGIPLGGGGLFGAQEATDSVFLGTIKQKIARKTGGFSTNAATANYGLSRMGKSDKTATVTAVQTAFEQLSDAKVRHMALLLAIAGYAGADVDKDTAREFATLAPRTIIHDMHLKFLTDAAEKYANGWKLTPENYLKQLVEYRLGDKFDGDLDSLQLDSFGGEEGGNPLANATRTTTNKSVDFMDPADARALVRGLLQNELGRDPTQAEYEDFVATIHSTEAKSPTTTSTTTRYDDLGMPVSTSSTRHGGITQDGLQQELFEEVKETPSWAKWQAVGTYAPALFAALGSAVEGT